MTAPAIHPDAIDAALPDFDADVACEVQVVSTGEPCGASAVWRVRAHGFRSAQDLHCSIRTILMCDPCLNHLRDKVEEALADGPVRCSDCQKVIRQMSDALLSVVAL
ncbi:hypothetical protein SEA_EASLEY_50 [Gordonia phage Easley]|uniref:Uncharacterized protein n=1 Tax=Gordonia phage Easley TaxID=2182395 RepID=A0A2U8UMV7_9CAUD|nr:tail fiber protein [Gordonia phage Easley]AWN05074.1 hypothetical protein SEA_EASLEY_50 [Gordonia phage Easley]